MNEVTERPMSKGPDGSGIGIDVMILECSCGALCFRKIDRRRFLKRHPALCNERRQVARELSEGTRVVDSEEGRMVWDKTRTTDR